jgi:hypothetical protein
MQSAQFFHKQVGIIYVTDATIEFERSSIRMAFGEFLMSLKVGDDVQAKSHVDACMYLQRLMSLFLMEQASVGSAQ